MAVKLNVDAFVKDYCEGLPDRDLLGKHHITAKEMVAVVKKLIQDGKITKEQYFGRTQRIQELEARQERDFLKSLYHCPVCSHIQPTAFSCCPACGHEMEEPEQVGEVEAAETGGIPPNLVVEEDLAVPANDQPDDVVSDAREHVPVEPPEAVPEALERMVGMGVESVSLLAGAPEKLAALDFTITRIMTAGVQSAMFEAEAGDPSAPHVAVKVFDPTLLPQPELEEVVSTIVAVQAAMSDLNVLTIYGSASVAGTPAIIYEYLPLTLDTLLEREPEGLSIDLLMALLPQALNAIGYSHMHRGTDGQIRRLPHLNLKLPRFFLDEKEELLKLEGCGVWRSFVDVRGYKTNLWEEPGVDIGALAPEAFVLNSKFVNPFHVDIYMLGTVMYKLATGRAPFSGSSVKEYSFAHLRKFPIPPKVHRYTLPGWLDSMILKCMEKEPENRWRSATQMELQFGKDFIVH